MIYSGIETMHRIRKGQIEKFNLSLFESAKQQSIATIASFTAKGDLKNLKTFLNDGLDNE